MSYPTRAQVLTRFQNLLDDPSGQVFTEDVFAEPFSEAYTALFTAFLQNQVPRIELITSLIVPPATPSLTPAQLSITDFGDYIHLAERPAGSTHRFRDLIPQDRLHVRPPTNRLLDFVYRNDTFYFGGGGATQAIELEVTYDSTGTAPTADNTTIAVDSSVTFLGNYAAGVTAGRKGYDAVGQRCMNLAVGPAYDQGVIGGELLRLVQTRVRSRQKVPIAPKPFTAFGRLRVRRAIPYVEAQMGTTGGSWSANAPVQFSTVNSTITGTIDGTNTVFWLSIGGVTTMTVYRNGVLQTSGVDYTSVNNQITFTSAPQPGDIITAEAYFS